ncbi:MAG: 6,7-dimethyl-8-ribityllumazine synthase [Chitinivibrionales bacterium]
MARVIEGNFSGSGKRFGIIAGRFNEFITGKLIEGAMDGLKRHNAESENITILWVPGAFEIPMATAKLADSGNYDALICLGAVIRGDTPHFNYVASEVSKGIASIGINTKTPVIYGILTTDTIDQAVERAGTKSGNKGFDAALSALEMADLMQKI